MKAIQTKSSIKFFLSTVILTVWKPEKKVFVVVITWIVNLSYIWLLIVFRDRSFTFVFKKFNLFFEFKTMFVGETFVVKNFFLLKRLCSLIQNFSTEKKLFQLCLCDTIHNSLCRVLFPLDEQTVLSFWFFEQFFLSEVISRKKTLVFSLPSVCWKFKNDRCCVKHWRTFFLEKPCSNCHRLPLFYHCPNQLHFTCRVGSGWWRIDKLYWLETWTFETCKSCKSCLREAYVKTFEI